jgi:tRNA threonylcarbamoyladenosine biosynthesis protein TsaE
MQSSFETVYTLVGLPELAGEIKHRISSSVVAVYGDMGAGKTTLIKALCRSFGVTDEVSSPTFSLVNEYLTGDGKRIYHFDLYRVEDIEEVLDIGIEEYLESGSLCLIEWPACIEDLLPENANSIQLFDEGGTRRLVMMS